MIRQEPALYDIHRSRWRRCDVQEVIPELAGYTLSGVGKVLKRLGLRLKRGRLSLHSPDPAYEAKMAKIARALGLARTRPRRVALCYGDEFSFYRQPTLSSRWDRIGQEPTAPLSHRSNTRWRICGGLEAVTGQVTWRGASSTRIPVLRQFLRDLRAAHPDRHLFLVWDHWPVHAHADVLAEARTQRIHLLWLPTYAPWENPIEKRWRWCKQEHGSHHHQADRWRELKQQVSVWLDDFATGSDTLLRYVGLEAH